MKQNVGKAVKIAVLTVGRNDGIVVQYPFDLHKSPSS